MPDGTVVAALALILHPRLAPSRREYARSTHPDGRVRDRIVRIGRAWLERPGAAIPAIFPARPARKATYLGVPTA